MADSTQIKKYNYDVAISLCNEDIGFARQLVKGINPGLKVYFYDSGHEEFISKSGPEEFSKIYKEESRVVVVLSRDNWSKSFYTEIERNAIMDRVKTEGFNFLMMVPMVHEEVPPWYPTTHIYVNLFRFSVDQIAQFVEFKVSELGGVIKALTVEDNYQHFIDRIKLKRSIIELQNHEEAIESADSEITILKECFNKKMDFLSKTLFSQISIKPFSLTFHSSHFSMGKYLLECRFLFYEGYSYNISTTQDVIVEFKLSELFDNYGEKKLIEEDQRIFYYNYKMQGWATPVLFDQPTKEEARVLFSSKHLSSYDLIDIIDTEGYVDSWFKRLLAKSSEAIERYL